MIFVLYVLNNLLSIETGGAGQRLDFIEELKTFLKTKGKRVELSDEDIADVAGGKGFDVDDLENIIEIGVDVYNEIY